MRHVRTSLVLLVLAIFVVGSAVPLHAQLDSVRVQLFRPPPNQLKVADLWRVRLDNRTNRTIEVYLFGTVDEAKDGKIVDATTARFRLAPGSRTVTGAEIQPIDATYYIPRYKDVFLRTGQAPTGDYTVCVTVREAGTDRDLGTDCYDQRVEVLTPPILVAPIDGATVEEKLPVFSWLPPAPLKSGQRVNYSLKIVEILGRQTPYDALQSNPAFFERGSLPTTVLQYPIGSRAFREKSHYAWRVTAADGTFPLGESEIWEFTFTGGTKFSGIGDDPIGNVDPTDGGIKPRKLLNGTVGERHWGVQFIDFDGDRTKLIETWTGVTVGGIGGLSDRPKVEVLIPPTILNQLLTPCVGK